MISKATSLRWDLTSFSIALLVHAPFFWMKLDVPKGPNNPSIERLVSIDWAVPEKPKLLTLPQKPDGQILERLKALPHREVPPPSVTQKYQPEKAEENPKPIALPSKLSRPTNDDRLVSMADKGKYQIPPTMKANAPAGNGSLLVDRKPHPLPIPNESTTFIGRGPIHKIHEDLIEKASPFVITGPLQGRAIEQKVLPEYPDWAQARGIEALVILEFAVQPNGAVENIIVVRRTSGYPLLDQTAIQALRQWKFAALPEKEIHNEAGQITFKYSLR